MSLESAQHEYFNSNECWGPGDYHAPRADGFTSGWKANCAESEAELRRLRDLVRHQRYELHEANLISDGEFAQLAQDHSAVTRLETYDSARTQITALQSERDALREALLPFKPNDEEALAYVELAHPDKPRKYPITVTDRDLLRVHLLLTTPASGEPARNVMDGGKRWPKGM